jgi:hypothetical protein
MGGQSILVVNVVYELYEGKVLALALDTYVMSRHEVNHHHCN